MKHIATKLKTEAQLESGELQDLLRANGTKNLSVTRKGKEYGIIEIIKDSGQVILMGEAGEAGIKSSTVLKELGDTLGQDIFVEIDGDLHPALDFKQNKIQASEERESQTAKCTKHLDPQPDSPVTESRLAQVIASVVQKIAPPVSKSIFTGKTVKDSYFDESDPGFSGLPVVVGPVKGKENVYGYIGYNTKQDELQGGTLNFETGEMTSDPVDGKLRHLDWMIKAMRKLDVEFDDNAMDKFHDFVYGKTERRASQTKKAKQYNLVEDKQAGNTMLDIGDKDGRTVYLITSDESVASAEIEINWGGDERQRDDFEYVQIDDVVLKTRELTNIVLNKKDKNFLKLLGMYGL